MSCCGGGCGSGSKSDSSDNNDYNFKPTDDKPLMLTDSAVKAVKNAISEEGEAGDGLRVAVVSGGCSGFSYSLDFAKEPSDGDLALEFDGVKVFVDSVSAGYLKGTVIDFVTGLQGTGFKFNNPNAKRSCGCGNSFS